MMEIKMEKNGTSDFIVRVRGLPWSTKESEVKEFFSACEDIRLVHFTYTREGRPTGEAYIELGSGRDVEMALLKHREHLKNRYIEVFEAKRSEMEFVLKRTSKPLVVPESADTVVRMRGLPFGSSTDDITSFFTGLEIAPDGIVRATDRSGRLTGEAYVKFLDKETTEKALDKHMQEIGHRYIEVFRSTEDEMMRAKYRTDMPGTGGGGDEGFFGGSGKGGIPSLFDDIHHPSYGGGGGGIGGMGGGDRFNRERSPIGRPKGGIGRATGHLVHMRGIPFKSTATDIVEFFKPTKVLNVDVMFDELSGRPMGEADVEFLTHDDAVEAMKKDKQHMGERYVDLFLNSTAPIKPEAAPPEPLTGPVKQEFAQDGAPGPGTMVQYPDFPYYGYDYSSYDPSMYAAGGAAPPPPGFY